MNRPYINASVYQLEALYETFKDDRRQLLLLFAELQNRRGPDARDLTAKVARRVNYLQLGTEEEAAGPAAAPPAGAASEAELLERIRRLEAELARVQASEESLRRHLAAARAALPEGVVLQVSDHARVHLAEGAPRWMVAAARTAFRKEYHPDRHQDAAARQRAHEVFVEADAIFAKLLGK